MNAIEAVYAVVAPVINWRLIRWLCWEMNLITWQMTGGHGH